jgi:hypothetical protein
MKTAGMPAHPASAIPTEDGAVLNLTPVADFPELRALAWDNDVLYASRGYSLLRAKMNVPEVEFQQVAQHHPALWRNFSVSTQLSCRLFRDGLHALAVLAAGHLIAAAPKAILTLSPGEEQFRVSHKVRRGMRPLHITTAPNGHTFWGEYFNNPARDEVHIYTSTDHGDHWEVAYTFRRGTTRHVHNIVYDRWGDCLWVLTGDNGPECRILRANCDFGSVETVLAGNQQARAVALVPTPDALYFSSDTPFEANHIYRLDRRGGLTEVADVSSSSIYGCAVGEAIFFSTMVEPSKINQGHCIGLYGSIGGKRWQQLLQWKKDRWPMKWFQYGNAFLPDGCNTTGLLAVSTIATETHDLTTSLWRTSIS